MIVSISVSNFGPIKTEQTLSMLASKDSVLEDYFVIKTAGLRVLKLGLIYGPNASGKTTFLKAIEFLRNLCTQPAEKKTDNLDFSPFSLDKDSVRNNSRINIVFVSENKRYQYEVVFNRQYIVTEKMLYYPNGREAEFFSRITLPEKELAQISFGSTAKVSRLDVAKLEGNTIWNRTILGAFQKSNIDISELKQIAVWFENTLWPVVFPETNLTAWAARQLLNKPELQKAVIEYLAKADIQISNLNISENLQQLDIDEVENLRKMIKKIAPGNVPRPDSPIRVSKLDLSFEHTVINEKGDSYKGYIEDTEQSRGTLRFFGLSYVLSLLLRSPKSVGMDEIETSLHPELVKYFLLTFLANSENSQLIVTTHNVSLLEDSDILRHDAVWFTEKQADGSTMLYSAADFDTTVLRKGTSLSKAYKVGKLGARPNPGSIFIKPQESMTWNEN